MAIVTALLAATIACNSYNKLNNTKGNSFNNDDTMTGATKETMSTLLPLTPTPSLVGLAINYTLLMPIYLNWVVKLLADMEMYIGSVERIAYYAEASGKIENLQEHKNVREAEACWGNNNVAESQGKKCDAGQHENNEDIAPQTSTTAAVAAATTVAVADTNDKWLNLSANNKTTDNNVDTTITTAATSLAPDDNASHHHHHHHHHLATDDGYIVPVATKTKIITTTLMPGKEEAPAVKYKDNNDMTKIATLPLIKTASTTATSGVSSAPNITNKRFISTLYSNTSSQLLDHNDAERAAIEQPLTSSKEQCKLFGY